MRFTRPGARPCQVSCLESTQLRGGVFGPRVDYERAGAQLRAGEVLQLVAAAIGWVELDVKVMVCTAAAWGLLVHCHHVWKRNVEKAVVLLQHALHDPRERFAVLQV